LSFLIKVAYVFLTSPMRATCPAHLILLDQITRTIYGEAYELWSSLLSSFLLQSRGGLRILVTAVCCTVYCRVNLTGHSKTSKRHIFTVLPTSTLWYIWHVPVLGSHLGYGTMARNRDDLLCMYTTRYNTCNAHVGPHWFQSVTCSLRETCFIL